MTFGSFLYQVAAPLLVLAAMLLWFDYVRARPWRRSAEEENLTPVAEVRDVNIEMDGWIAFPFGRISFYDEFVVLGSMATLKVIRYEDVLALEVNSQSSLTGQALDLVVNGEASTISVYAKEAAELVEKFGKRTKATVGYK